MKRQLAKYLIIETDIINDIKSEVLKPGDKIASESQLKKKYNVSTITVRKAFSDLINEGYLYGVQGVGTFVAKKQMIRGLTSISFSDELQQQGYSVDMIVDEISETIDKEIAGKLGIENEATITVCKRIRIANKQPIAHHTSYISTKLLSPQDAKTIYDTKSLYKTMAHVHLYPHWVNENYSVREIQDLRVCEALNVELGYPSFFVCRTTFDEQDEIIEYAETYFNKDWYSVSVNIKS